MFCAKCGNELEDDALFCPKCGNKISGTNEADNKSQNQSHSDIKPDHVQQITNKLNKKTLICVGVGVIAVLLIIVLILVIKGGKKEGTTSDNTEVSSINEDSALKDIIGDWKLSGTVMSGYTDEEGMLSHSNYADLYDIPLYLKVESEGMSASDYTDFENKYFSLPTRKVNIYEEGGNTYYEIENVEVYGGSELGMNDIGIRFYYDDSEGLLICEYKVPNDDDWVKHAKYKQIDSIEEDGASGDTTSSDETSGDSTSSTNTPSATYDYTQELDDFLAGVIDMEDAARSDTSIAEEWAENQSIAQEILDEEIKPALENDLQNGAISQSEYDTFQEKITEIESHLSTNNVTSTNSDSTENSTGSSSDITPDEGDSYTGGY